MGNIKTRPQTAPNVTKRQQNTIDRRTRVPRHRGRIPTGVAHRVDFDIAYIRNARSMQAQGRSTDHTRYSNIKFQIGDLLRRSVGRRADGKRSLAFAIRIRLIGANINIFTNRNYL